MESKRCSLIITEGTAVATSELAALCMDAEAAVSFLVLSLTLRGLGKAPVDGPDACASCRGPGIAAAAAADVGSDVDALVAVDAAEAGAVRELGERAQALAPAISTLCSRSL